MFIVVQAYLGFDNYVMHELENIYFPDIINAFFFFFFFFSSLCDYVFLLSTI